MENKTSIEINDVSMKFNLGQEKIDNLKEYVIKFVKGKLLYKEFWALKDINVSINKGEVFGIVGLNGSGKSTLLKIIAGVMKPTKGHINVNGSMAPLIELGAGFDPNLTGRENIFLNGAILGFSKAYMKEKYDEIVEFSELDQFIDVPIKNYSSGMRSRLGFSIAVFMEPEILIVDEVLSVGDYKFQEKSFKKMQEIINKGITVIFVSHSINQVKKICGRVMWLEKGKIRAIGDTENICEKFMNK